MKYRRQNQREQTDHTDDWLMTYADMITLLLCFFAVFLSVSMPHKDVQQKIQIPQPVVEQPIQEPEKPSVILQGDLPFHTVEEDDDQPTDTVQEAAMSPTPFPPVQTVQPVPIPSASLPEIVDNLKAQGPANIEQKGDRLTTMVMSSGAFFDSGSATLNIAGKTILRAVAANIKSEEFRDYQITVEGHTDDTPIKTLQFPSNWELSTARASAVVHFFIDEGIPPQRLRAAGYADTFPLVSNRDDWGKPVPENQAQNRRVVIKLEKLDKTEQN